MKNILLLILVVVLAVVAAVIYQHYGTLGHASGSNVASSPDYKNATYSVDGQSITLMNGKAETDTAPGSASKTTVQYFGNDAMGDLNGDGRPDVAFLLTVSGGGSGTFYYVVAALQGIDSYAGTNAVFLGDRIAPQTTEIQNDEIIVNYADRKSDEPMTVQPSVGVSKHLRVSGTTLEEVIQP